MKKIVFILLWSHVLTLASKSAAQQKYYELSEATKMSIKAEMPILALFVTKKCRGCDTLISLINKNIEIQSIINTNFIPTIIKESLENTFLLDKYAIEAFPQIVIIKSNGDQLYRFSGRDKNETIVNHLRTAREKYLGYLQYKMDLDTITKLESFLNLSTDYINFNSLDNIYNTYNEAIKYNPSLRRILFDYDASFLDYENLYSLFLDDPDKFRKNSKLRDLLVIAYFNKNKKILDHKNTKDFISRFRSAGFKNLEETMAYLKVKVADQEVLQQQGVTNLDYIPINLVKDFVWKYPHCHDKKMLSKCVQHLVLNNDNERFYAKVLKEVQIREKEYPEDYMLQDIKSVCLYVLGQKEKAMKTVSLANDLAFKAKQKYEPSLKVLSNK